MALLTASYSLDALICLATVFYGIYLYFTWSFNYWKKRNVPFVKPIPFVGNFWKVFSFKTQMGVHLGELYQIMTSKYFGIWIFGRPTFILRDPEVIKNIMVKDFNYFADHNFASDEKADSIVSNVLFALKNPHWKTMRSRLTPMFTSGKMKLMLPLMLESAESMVEYIKKKSLSTTNNCLEAKELSAKYTIEIITSCAFGLQAKCFEQEDAPFRLLGKEMFDFNLSNAIRHCCFFFAPALVSFFRISFFNAKVNNFVRDIFWKTIKLREENQVKRNDLIDVLIDIRKLGKFIGSDFEGDRVLAQPVQFFAAGFETTASAMSFMIYEMAMNPEMQKRLRSEINGMLAKNNGEISCESIKTMTYMDQIYKETLRKHPIFPILERCCTKDYKMPDEDLVIEKGTAVYIPAFGLHRDPQYFPNPTIFDPERFNSENVGNIVPYSYLAFGQGPHNCVGERIAYVMIKLALVHLFANFSVETNQATPKSIDYDPKGIVLQSDVGLPLNFVPIERKCARVG